MSTPLGLQLYTLRSSLADDFAGTIRRVAQIGYAGVETDEFPGTTPAAARALCDDLGLKIVACHGPLPIGATRQEAIDLAGALNTKRLVVPWLDPEHFASRHRIDETADLLNIAAAEARSAGLQLAYHNHWFEFEPVEGVPAFERLLPRLSLDLDFELDLYWARVGGADVATLLRRLGARVPLIHVKDGPATDTESAMTAVGDGRMGYPALLRGHCADWLIVELDRCDGDLWEAVSRSHTNLAAWMPM